LQGEDFWALKDVSFDVQPGEVVGIIGRNGAGKSTLLKILSRITEPTSGRVELRGRVGSLLEVGTGFHPELSGRENIYMNGSVLGMSHREIQRKFDEIVEFSGIEDFLDTPVKRYSSGMYVRLAFAVAAHLEPEILIVDEVLAVGDAQFQSKCLGAMKDVASHGRTVLFVSHNLAALQRICRTAILLRSGLLAEIGDIGCITRQYLREIRENTGEKLQHRRDRKGSGRLRIQEIAILRDSMQGRPLATGSGASFCFHLDNCLPRTEVSFVIHDALGAPVVAFHSRRRSAEDSRGESSTVTCHIPELQLLAGNYSLTVAAWVGDEQADYVERAVDFDVENAPWRDRVFSSPDLIPGSVCFRHRWQS
jgi:lipopolysaccharide transport system ATP-binding protein